MTDIVVFRKNRNTVVSSGKGISFFFLFFFFSLSLSLRGWPRIYSSLPPTFILFFFLSVIASSSRNLLPVGLLRLAQQQLEYSETNSICVFFSLLFSSFTLFFSCYSTNNAHYELSTHVYLYNIQRVRKILAMNRCVDTSHWNFSFFSHLKYPRLTSSK